VTPCGAPSRASAKVSACSAAFETLNELGEGVAALRGRDGCGVHQDVHGAGGRLDARERVAHRARVAHVGGHGHHRAAQEARQAVQAHRVLVDEGHVRMLLEQGACRGEPQGARRPGDDGGLALERHQRGTRAGIFAMGTY
jgi:hypothetical protein